MYSAALEKQAKRWTPTKTEGLAGRLVLNDPEAVKYVHTQ